MLANPVPAPPGPPFQLQWDDALPLRLQIEELTQALDFLLAQRLTLSGCWLPGEAVGWEADPEELALRHELDELVLLETGLEARQLQEQEQQAQREREQQLRGAQLIARQSERDEQIARHDHLFAATLAALPQDEWVEFGDQIDDAFVALPLPPATIGPSCSSSSSSQPSTSRVGASTSSRGAKSASSELRENPSSHPSPAPTAVGSSGYAPQQLPCNICFDSFSAAELVQAGDTSAPSTSSSIPGCGHLSCRPCMRQYVQTQLAGRSYPLTCPEPQCSSTLLHSTVLSLVEESQADLQALREAEIASAIPPSQRLYCPHKDCSALLLKADHDVTDEPASCLHCNRTFCPSCLVAGWHQGYSCEAFQRLPAHQRSVEDAALLTIAAKKRWKTCPACCIVVERTQGCNHVHCRCGADFCYNCGKQYASKTPMADNAHGTPSCKCELFEVPAEAPAEAQAAAAPQLQPAGFPAPARAAAPNPQPAGPRPWRNGRKVSRTPCRHSASIHDCPKRQSCWFSHVEDGL